MIPCLYIYTTLSGLFTLYFEMAHYPRLVFNGISAACIGDEQTCFIDYQYSAKDIRLTESSLIFIYIPTPYEIRAN